MMKLQVLLVMMLIGHQRQAHMMQLWLVRFPVSANVSQVQNIRERVSIRTIGPIRSAA